MPITYLATLKDNQHEWVDDSPALMNREQPMSVSVSLVESLEEDDKIDKGIRMAVALEKIAARGARGVPDDAAKWEREIRDDRSLPGRLP